jgi:hypothetical protein
VATIVSATAGFLPVLLIYQLIISEAFKENPHST